MESNSHQPRDIFDFSQELGSAVKHDSISLGITEMPSNINNSQTSSLSGYATEQEYNILSKWSQQEPKDYTASNIFQNILFRPLQTSQELGSNEATAVELLSSGVIPTSSTNNSSNNGTVTSANLVTPTVSSLKITVGATTTTSDWYSVNLKDSQISNLARSLAQDNDLSRNDFLTIFHQVELKSQIDSNELADLKTLTSISTTPFKISEDVKFLATKVAQGTTLNMSATTFDSTLVGRWFLGTVPPTASFNNTTLTYATIQGSLFGATGHAQIADIDQGGFGDCSFMAALGATFAPQSNDVTHSMSKTIDNMIIDNHDNTYAVKFYDNGKAEYVTVDRRVATANTSGQTYGAHSKTGWSLNNSKNVIWSALVERAYAQWREGREGKPGYNIIGNGDSIQRPLGYVTGKSVSSYSSSTVTFSILQSALASGHAIETGRMGATNDYIVGGHAYSVTNAYTDTAGQQHVVVRNPWGVDGVKTGSGDKQDGFVDLLFNNFKSYLDIGVAIA